MLGYQLPDGSWVTVHEARRRIEKMIAPYSWRDWWLYFHPDDAYAPPMLPVSQHIPGTDEEQ